MFVRLFVDENLDRMVPISKQPKEKIQAIIDSCRRQFPEYQERARKRIRTYLKSCRRMKRSGFEMVSFEWKHSPRFHPNPTCKPWHYLFFHPSVFFYLFFHDVRSQGFCLLVCFPPSPLHLPEVYLSLVYSTRSTRWASAHRPTWNWAIGNEGHRVKSHENQHLIHVCCFLLHRSGDEEEHPRGFGWPGRRVSVQWEEVDGSI